MGCQGQGEVGCEVQGVVDETCEVVCQEGEDDDGAIEGCEEVVEG